MSHLRRTLVAWFAIFAVVALAGCGKSNRNPSAPTDTGQVMVVHAAPDAPAVDVLLDGNMLSNNLAFPNHTSYMSVASGTHDVKAVATGTSTTVVDASVPVTTGTSYTLFANGTAANLGVLTLTDDLTAPPAGKANVRFVHLSPNAPTVDVAIVGGAILFPNESFRQSTSFTAVDPGSVNMELRGVGTATVVLAVPNVTLEPGKIYTLFVTGLVGGTGQDALSVHTIVHN